MREAGPTGDGRAQPWRRAGALTGIRELGRQQEARGAILGTGGLAHQVLRGKLPTVQCSLREGGRPGRSRQRALYRVMLLPESGSVL